MQLCPQEEYNIHWDDVYDASICSAALRCWASCGPTHIFNTLNILLLFFYPSKIYKRLTEDLRMMSSTHATNSGHVFAVTILRSRPCAAARLEGAVESPPGVSLPNDVHRASADSGWSQSADAWLCSSQPGTRLVVTQHTNCHHRWKLTAM